MERLLSFFKRNRIEVDVCKFIDVKEKAIETYKTNMTVISHKQKEPLHTSIDEFLRSKEIFYRSK